MDAMQHPTTSTHRRDSGREEGLMASNFETQAREFAAEFPTPNVQRAIALAEAGTLSWEQVAEVFAASLVKGLAAVA